MSKTLNITHNYNGHVSGSALLARGDDMRGVDMRGSSWGFFDARGKSLTYEFCEGARFDKLMVDETTKLFSTKGVQLKSEAYCSELPDGSYELGLSGANIFDVLC